MSSASRLVSFVLPALWLSTQPHFAMIQVWYLSVASVASQAVFSLWLVRRELRLRLTPRRHRCLRTECRRMTLQTFVSVAGWAAALLILGAYGLLSFGKIMPSSLGLSGDEHRRRRRIHHQLCLQQCLAVGGAQCRVDGNRVLRIAPKCARSSGGVRRLKARKPQCLEAVYRPAGSA